MPSKHIKKKHFIFLLLLFLLFLTGCAFKDIDKNVFVAMVAIDKSDEEKKPYKITLKIYEPVSSFKQSTQPEYSYISESGETLSEAIRLLQSYTDKELDFGHTKLIVIGEELVKEDKNHEILDFLIRRPDIQMISWIAVGRSTADEVIKLEPKGERAGYPELFNFLDHNGTESQYVVTTYLFHFRRNMKEYGIDPVLPIIEIDAENKHFKINKSLLIANNKRPYELNSLNTALYNILREKTNHAEVVIMEDGEQFIAKIDTIKSNYKVNILNDDKIELEIEMGLYGYISESKKALNNMELPRYNKLLKKEAEEKFKEFLDELKKIGYDPLGFGINYKGQKLHNHRMSKDEWQEAYKNAKVKIKVNPGLKSTGSIQ